ncbi:MAG: xanthine dehydrogenase family protein molybdopterin-binding subunit [Alphaproteobacteria bacterium]|nr:xanthine dehydrogenase family protein molybdopterin-binding subunit [Alphaproteobacteria bacterium]
MYVGQSVPRREDFRFLTGRGRYVADVAAEHSAVAVFVRSPHAHARIARLDIEAAKSSPGVLAVLTAADWHADGLGVLPCIVKIPSADGSAMLEATRPALADGIVRHVGDVVTAVIAKSGAAARDAAELIGVEYEALPAVTDVRAASAPGAPIVHAAFGTNVAFSVEFGDRTMTERALASATHIETLDLRNNRITANSIEPRACLAEYDVGRDLTTLWATSQTPHLLRRWIAEHSVRIPEQRLRVVAPDVGGGFGMKVYHYPEDAIVVWAATRLRRAVRWTGERSESIASDTHGRDHATSGRLALDSEGRILGLAVDTLGSLGAYVTAFGPMIVGAAYPRLLSGLYRIPAIHVRVRGVYTNTNPIGAYRGAGRPEANFVIDRLIENAARTLQIDVGEIRRRNMVQPSELPYHSPLGPVYEGGDYPALLAKMLALVRYESLRDEQRRWRSEGRLLGIGLSAYIDRGGIGPSRTAQKTVGEFGGWESAIVRVHPTGRVTVLSGNHSQGQSHETVFAQVVADRLQVPIDTIEVVQGDTDRIPHGHGTWGSRSIGTGAIAARMAADRIVEKARILAAHILECAATDVAYEDGAFVVRGTDRSIPYAMIVKAAYHGGNYPDGFELGLEASVFYDPKAFNFPTGVQLCVVTIDRETGAVAIRSHHAIDDVGLRVNPMVVEGQIHGGIAQGIGQALFEQISYDKDSGQLLTGSFMDYAMPRAEDMPTFVLAEQTTLTTSNPLGAKGIGESGPIGAPTAVANAVIDALWHLGVRTIDMPFTSERVWHAIQTAERA